MIKTEIKTHWRYWVLVLSHATAAAVTTLRAVDSSSNAPWWWTAAVMFAAALGLHAATGRKSL